MDANFNSYIKDLPSFYHVTEADSKQAASNHQLTKDWKKTDYAKSLSNAMKFYDNIENEGEPIFRGDSKSVQKLYDELGKLNKNMVETKGKRNEKVKESKNF